MTRSSCLLLAVDLSQRQVKSWFNGNQVEMGIQLNEVDYLYKRYPQYYGIVHWLDKVKRGLVKVTVRQ